jgi:transcriptional regulator with XRE-family HTH domain
LKENKLSQAQLSRLTGITEQTISYLARDMDREQIDRKTTEKLMRHFNCSFERLWTIEWI